MTTSEIKDKLFSSKLDCIMNSDFGFLYRDTIEFILEKHKQFSEKIKNPKITNYLLPCAIQSDFLIHPAEDSQKKLLEIIEAQVITQAPEKFDVQLINYPENEENQLAELILFKNTDLGFRQIRKKVNLMTIEQKENITNQYFLSGTYFHELNSLHFTFEISLDLVSLKQLKKYSSKLFIQEPFSVKNGYYTPREIAALGIHGDYILVMKRALDAYHKIYPHLSTQAFYLIPLAFLQKILFTININQLIKIDLPIADKLWQHVKSACPTLYQGVKS